CPERGQEEAVAASNDQGEVEERFRRQYGLEPSEAAGEVERRVIGGNFGASGYTTVAQADLLAECLELGPGGRLLDVGSGRGWPGLYLAGATGCDVVLTDLPLEAMFGARLRSRGEENLRERSRFVVSRADRLPFRPETFDAVVHTDVLC
ncbi:MAG: SAM-dependent methyltransferase, partial [Acidimicrobiia bacterium]